MGRQVPRGNAGEYEGHEREGYEHAHAGKRLGERLPRGGKLRREPARQRPQGCDGRDGDQQGVGHAELAELRAL